MNALQTHGLFEERWIPPKDDRFTRYEPRDESWARPLSRGTVQRQPMRLYDVRDDRLQLLGYVRNNPADCKSWYLNFAVAPQPSTSFHYQPDRPDQLTCVTLCVREVAWKTVHRSGGYIIERALCWVATIDGAIVLLEAGKLVSGADNMREWTRHLREMHLARLSESHRPK